MEEVCARRDTSRAARELGEKKATQAGVRSGICLSKILFLDDVLM